ncbi:hypothetical protein MY10362_004611 [Beauveria mimosiformis]
MDPVDGRAGDAADHGIQPPDGTRGKSCGENWVRKFVKRHDEIKAKYSRRYDYQRAKCEDPQLLAACKRNNSNGWHGDEHTPSPQNGQAVCKTPYNINQLATHPEALLERRPEIQDSPVSQAINQLIKGCQTAMHSAVLLADENCQLRRAGLVTRRTCLPQQTIKLLQDSALII